VPSAMSDSPAILRFTVHDVPSIHDPDPIDEPKAYQDLLLGLVGDDDPAVVQGAAPGQIRALLDEAGPDARTRPEPKEWSVLECVAHIADAEIVYAGRYRWILAHDQPELIGYDQDLWVDRLHQPVEEPAQLLALFEPLRQANLDLWARTPISDRDRVGLHRERGPESFALSFTLIAGHDRLHLAQARRALDLVREAG
jgi:DinB superfamily